MTLPTHTPTLDQVFTRHSYNVIGSREYKDQKYKRRPMLMLLRERRKKGDGGPNIAHRVNLGTTFNGRSLSRNERFSIEGDSNETWSRYTWSVVIETCFVSWWDIREADGGMQKVLGILESRINETRENIEDNISTQLAQSTAADADDINPILSIVATSGASGGLNPSTDGQEVWASENEDTISWIVEGVSRTRKLNTKITDNKGNPDVILVPDQTWLDTCDIGDAAMVINQNAATRGGTKYADLGLQVPFILGIPVIHDPAWNTAQSATGVMLDLDGIHLVVDPRWDMYMWEFKDMAHNGILGKASLQVEVAQLTCSSRRTQGLLSTLS